MFAQRAQADVLAYKELYQAEGMDMLKKVAEDTSLECVRLRYEEYERDVAQWSAKMKAKKLPKNNEIKAFFKE